MLQTDTLAFPRDHHPHPVAEVEWWYLFGFLGDRYTLMVCFWRYRGRDWPADGLMAAYALTAVDGSARRQSTFVDAQLFRHTREMLRRHVARSPDTYYEATVEVMDADGLFAPFRLAPGARLQSGVDVPVDIRIGGCRLRHDAATRRLHLEITDGDLEINLCADAAADFFPMGKSGQLDLDRYRNYGYTHPRMPLHGTLARGGRSEPVGGELWFDHQWGDWPLESPLPGFYHPEWRYYGVLLDDGASLVCYEVAPLDKVKGDSTIGGVYLDTRGGARELGRVRFTPRDHTSSLRTGNVYEYGWSIELPDLDGTLELVPFHPDHEVNMFAQQRGILELGCRVSGTLLGRPCRGVAFVEAFGEVSDANGFFWGHSKTNLARQLDDCLPRTCDPRWLQWACNAEAPLTADAGAIERALLDPIRSMLERGGKGWRSAWLLTCCYALGYDRPDRKVREFLPAIEMLHTGSLIIDDIEDESPLRRGRPTLHREIGQDLAINAGNFLYFLPFRIVQRADWLSVQQRADIQGVMLNALCQGHVGQAMDLMWSKNRLDLPAKIAAFARTRAELLEQYRLKAGTPVEAIARIAGIISAAPAPQCEALAQYSRAFGIVFQIVDDLIEVQEGRDKLGKQEGEDVCNGKLNMVLLHALAAASEAERRVLMDALQRGAAGLADAREIIERTDAIERCIALAEEIIEAAWRHTACLPATDAKIIMRSVPMWLLRQRRARYEELRRATDATRVRRDARVAH